MFTSLLLYTLPLLNTKLRSGGFSTVHGRSCLINLCRFSSIFSAGAAPGGETSRGLRGIVGEVEEIGNGYADGVATRSGSGSVAEAGCAVVVSDDGFARKRYRAHAAWEAGGGSWERMALNLAARELYEGRGLNGGRSRSGESAGRCGG
ncbi:hypothetical protein DFH06DRAFT_1226177 [Mycena polygramma]|nr:hypothetical protein DFH06DRAFT_1226177 [Mycena polygramma]